ncbi:MAG: peptidoglycan DD-metalloendopeptidase family protein [Alphaproteobacteria bacterium]|nr:peptidoglycan DD-metalloendopeptidase family protein [Alphaproteobacteria bacterium]
MRAFVLSTQKQLMAAGGVAVAALWMGVCTAAMLVNALSATSADREVARTQAKYERWIADRQARLNSAVAELNAGAGGPQQLAATVEKRHEALAMLLTDMKAAPGAAQALMPALAIPASANAGALRRMAAVEISQDRVLDAADSFAKSRADRLRLAFRLAGLTPSAYVPEGGALGGPLIESRDPRALAAVLDVSPEFAERIQHAAQDISEAEALDRAAESLPFGRPTSLREESSGYGVRIDPFTHRPAFHSGLDFPGPRMTPVASTGPGVVSFTGVRTGYGNTVEVDHGGGLKTRYGHLATIAVHVGEHVTLGETLGGIGSTGRSTGPHLHYEVWLNGRPMNPERYLKAGAYVREAG